MVHAVADRHHRDAEHDLEYIFPGVAGLEEGIDVGPAYPSALFDDLCPEAAQRFEFRILSASASRTASMASSGTSPILAIRECVNTQCSHSFATHSEEYQIALDIREGGFPEDRAERQVFLRVFRDSITLPIRFGMNPKLFSAFSSTSRPSAPTASLLCDSNAVRFPFS